MIVKDMNQTLVQPEGLELSSVQAAGAFLLIRYSQAAIRNGSVCGKHYTVIYLNDQGREVLRTEEEVKPDDFADAYLIAAKNELEAAPPKKFWETLKAIWKFNFGRKK